MTTHDLDRLHFDMSAEEYHGDPCPSPSLSSSLIREMLARTPAHAAAIHPRITVQDVDDGEPKRITRAMIRGTVAHKLLLGRGADFTKCDFKDWKSKDAQALRNRLLKAGKIPVLVEDAIVAERAVKAAREQLADFPGCENAFRSGHGRAEVVNLWRDEAGIWGRSMKDWLHIAPAEDAITVYDYKTTDRSAAPESMRAKAANDGLHIQAAWYERGLIHRFPNAAGRITFRFVVQEMAAPYMLSVAELDSAFMTIGRKQVAAAVDLWSRAIETGNFPGYHRRVATLECPPWLENGWLNREMNDEMIAETGDDPFTMRAKWIPNIRAPELVPPV